MLALVPVVLLLLYYIVFKYFTSKEQRKFTKEQDAYWAREELANNTRKKSLDSLPLLEIPLLQLPFIEDTEDEDLKKYQAEARQLAERKLANLNAFSNTDLKLTYGVGNLHIISNYEQNYFRFLRMLCLWAKRLYALNYIQESRSLLELGLTFDTDLSDHYELLGKIYLESLLTDEFENLRERSASLQGIAKEKVQARLEALKPHN